ncbi:MAG: M23 family metallopeptidase [Zoogloea sp.]|nr:M23 family metallopeptidase [Zoogloea sp.]
MDIQAAVGAWEKGARNERKDVEAVQTVLAQAARLLGWADVDPKGVDGSIARPPRKSGTVAAIKAFQLRVGREAPGVLAPASEDWGVCCWRWRAHRRRPGAIVSFLCPAGGGRLDPSAPVLRLPAQRGRRAHAGCDLYAPVGRLIHAVRDGVVIRDPYPFYAQTDALEIDHGDFVIRYGEIKPDCTLRKGERVKAGQVIARVGLLVGIQVPSAMLHLEMYDGSASGPLTAPESVSARRADGVPFLRRADLMDPTPFLNVWRTRLAGT